MRKLDDWLQGWIDYTERSEPPYLYRFWCGISVIAAALQRKCYIPWGTLTFYPNLYIILTGPPGRTRKGTAMNPALEMLDDLGISLAAESTTREALIRALLSAQDTVVDNETGQSYTHSSLTIFSGELTVFLGYQNHQLMSDLTDWYDCRKSWVYDTKTQGRDAIRGVYVNLLGATTPELIRTTLPMDAIGGGLTSRIIFVNEDKKGKVEPAPFLSQEQIRLKQDLFYDLEQIYMMKGPFRVTKNFITRWCEWYVYQENNPPFTDPFFDGYISRRSNHVMKLSMVISAGRRNSQEILEKDFDDALLILEQTEVKMPATFQGMGKSSNASVITNLMATIGNEKVITRSKLLRLHYRDVKDEGEFDRLISTIESTGFCKRSSEDGQQVIRYINSCENFTQVNNKGESYGENGTSS